MNRVYKDINEFLTETFPDFFKSKDQDDDETVIQSYIERSSHEFSTEMKRIINGQNLA